MSFVSMVKGVMTGALVGGILAAIAGGAVGGVMGSLASLTSMGSPTIVRNETIKWRAYGALTGTIIGSVVGVIVILVSGKTHGPIVGTVTGALVLALAGFMLGSIRTNDAPINTTRVIVLSSFGAIIGIIVGAALGWIINLPFR